MRVYHSHTHELGCTVLCMILFILHVVCKLLVFSLQHLQSTSTATRVWSYQCVCRLTVKQRDECRRLLCGLSYISARKCCMLLFTVKSFVF